MFRSSETFFGSTGGGLFANPPASNNATDLGSSSFAFRSLYLGTSLFFTGATTKIIPGATSLTFRNNADSASNLILADAGLVTVGVGNLALTAGNLTFGAASAKIIPGATSLLIRNNADSADNISITDAGVSTFRSTVQPATDNAVNLGATSLQFATLFVRTGLESSGAIKVKPSNSEALQFDSTGIRTNLTAFTIYTNTADGSDNCQISITAGGNAMDHTRGGYIRISGNEHANTGSVFIRTGDASAASIVLDPYGATGTIALKNQNTHIFQVTATGLRSDLSAGMLYANTSDTSDTYEFNLCGGGGSSISRGSRISVFGNEHATNGGQVGLTGGGVSTGHVYLTTNNASAYIQLSLNGTKDWEFRATNQLIYTTNALIAAATSDGSDSAFISLCGGGARSASRGAYLDIFGNEHAGVGSIYGYTGSATNATFAVVLGGSSATFKVQNSSGNDLWSVNHSGQIVQNGTNGGDIVFAVTSGIIRQNTSDGTDNKLLSICGGGSNAVSRGAYVEIAGNEHANGGAINIWGGAISTGNINSVIGHSSAKIQFFNASTAVMWDFNNSGDFNQNSSNGGNIVFSKSSTGFKLTADNAVSAAGSSASDATQLSKNVNFVSTVAASTGVKLWDGGAGFGPIIVRNGGANSLTIYAPTGHTINNSGNSQSCSTTQTIIYFQVSSTNWIALKA